MPQNRAESTALLHGVGECEMDRVSRRLKERRQRRQGAPFLWLAYRKLDPMQRQEMMGIQALPVSKAGGTGNETGPARRRTKRPGNGLQESSLLEALRQAGTWPAPLRLMILQDDMVEPDGLFLDRLERALDHTGFPPWRLDMSFAQSVFCEGSEQYWMNLAALRDGGVCVFMRDFLTPPSSISFLEEAYRASVVDGVQFRAASLLAEEEGGIFEGEMPFRQNLLRAVRALGLTAQICGVPAAQEGILGRYMGIDNASIGEDEDMWGVCEVMAPVSEALPQTPRK